jgi:hypothetical protein
MRTAFPAMMFPLPVEWKGNRRPSIRMGAVAMLRENIIKAKKMQKLLKIKKKVMDEVDH